MTAFKITQSQFLTGHKGAVFALAPAITGTGFYSGDGTGLVVHWQTNKENFGEALARVPSNIFALCCLPEQPILAVGTMQGALYFINVEQKQRLSNELQFDKAIFALNVYKNTLLCATGAGILSFIDVQNLEEKMHLSLSNTSLRCIALHPTKALAAIGSSDNNIYLVDLTQKKLQNTLKHHKNSVFSVVFSPCGNYLWSGGRDAQLTVWVANSENNYELLHTIPAHLFTINKLILIPEYKLIISASRDKSIKLWSTKTLQLCKVLDKSKPNLTMHSHSINNLLYLSNSQQLLAASDDRNISLWQLSSTN